MRLAMLAGLAALASIGVTSAAAAAAARPAGTRIAVEVDPITTALGARNLIAIVEPAVWPSWTIGGVFLQADFPDWVNDVMHYRNRGDDVDIELRPSPGVVVDYYSGTERTRWHVGGFVFLFRYEVSRAGHTVQPTNLGIMPRLGYRWMPSGGRGWYVDPFAGVLSEVRVGGESEIGPVRFRATPIVPFATVHVGFRF